METLPCAQVRGFNTVKMSIPSKLICGLNVILTETQLSFCGQIISFKNFLWGGTGPGVAYVSVGAAGTAGTV